MTTTEQLLETVRQALPLVNGKPLWPEALAALATLAERLAEAEANRKYLREEMMFLCENEDDIRKGLRTRAEQAERERDALIVEWKDYRSTTEDVIEQAEARIAELENFSGDIQAGCDIRHGERLYRQVEVVIGPGKTRDKIALEAAEAACGGLLWLDNNIHQWATQEWLDYFKAAAGDARRALSTNGDELISKLIRDGDAAFLAAEQGESQ